LNSLNPDVIIKQAIQLRPGHTCTLSIPSTPEVIIEADMYNGVNVHFPIIFDDGVKWLVRVRQVLEVSADREMMDQVMESEVTTIRVMYERGIPVPNAWLPLSNPSNPDTSKSGKKL
jgi:hypothetical protein